MPYYLTAFLATMSGPNGNEQSSSPETFTDWLSQIEGDYLHLTELYEKEREYGQRLAELVARVQHEMGFPIPLNPVVLSAAIPGATEAHLGEGAVIFFVDSAGNRGQRPLTLMPLETIIFTVHESTFRLKELIAEKRRLMARRVRALERVNLELDKAQEVLRRSQPDSEPELENAGEAPVAVSVEGEPQDETPEPVVGEASSEQLLVKVGEAPNAISVQSDSPKEATTHVEGQAPISMSVQSESPKEAPEPVQVKVEGFEYRGSFKDKRHVIKNGEWGPA